MIVSASRATVSTRMLDEDSRTVAGANRRLAVYVSLSVFAMRVGG
jgi:hypothetical protein